MAWRLVQALILVGLVYAVWQLFGHLPYRIDIEVYRMGGRAWLDGRPLYAGDTTFHTQIGLDLPFTYPPLAAILFSPFAWLSFNLFRPHFTEFALLGLFTAAYLLGIWGFPLEVVEVVAYASTPLACMSDSRSAAAVLCLADALVHAARSEASPGLSEQVVLEAQLSEPLEHWATAAREIVAQATIKEQS